MCILTILSTLRNTYRRVNFERGRRINEQKGTNVKHSFQNVYIYIYIYIYIYTYIQTNIDREVQITIKDST